MELDLLHIAMIFVFLTVLLLITTIYSRIWWQLKAVLIVFSVFFYLSTYTTMSSLLGRPTVQEIQDRAQILVFLAEPPRGQSKGRIILFVKDKDDFRLHEIPFNKESMKKLREARRESKKGGGVPKAMIHKQVPRGNRQQDTLINPNVQEHDLPEKQEPR